MFFFVIQEIDISALAGAATQVYTSNDSDTDQVEAEPKSNKLRQAKQPSINANIAEEPTLAYYENTDDIDDEPMDTEMTLDDEVGRTTTGYEDLAPQPADGMESEAGKCRNQTKTATNS